MSAHTIVQYTFKIRYRDNENLYRLTFNVVDINVKSRYVTIVAYSKMSLKFNFNLNLYIFGECVCVRVCFHQFPFITSTVPISASDRSCAIVIFENYYYYWYERKCDLVLDGYSNEKEPTARPYIRCVRASVCRVLQRNRSNDNDT